MPTECQVVNACCGACVTSRSPRVTREQWAEQCSVCVSAYAAVHGWVVCSMSKIVRAFFVVRCHRAVSSVMRVKSRTCSCHKIQVRVIR